MHVTKQTLLLNGPADYGWNKMQNGLRSYNNVPCCRLISDMEYANNKFS